MNVLERERERKRNEGIMNIIFLKIWFIVIISDLNYWTFVCIKEINLYLLWILNEYESDYMSMSICILLIIIIIIIIICDDYWLLLSIIQSIKLANSQTELHITHSDNNICTPFELSMAELNSAHSERTIEHKHCHYKWSWLARYI